MQIILSMIHSDLDASVARISKRREASRSPQAKSLRF